MDSGYKIFAYVEHELFIRILQYFEQSVEKLKLSSKLKYCIFRF